MAVYFEQRIDTGSASAIHTNLCWHKIHPLLAVASYAEELGGYVSLYNEEGQKLESDISSQSSSQVTSLAWHPLHKHLIIAWESGDIVLWNQEKRDCVQPSIMHKAPIILVEFSARGSRFISADTSGSMMCWKVDRSGQLTVVFHHELKDILVQIAFRTVTPSKSVDIAGLARAAVAGDDKALDLFSSWNLPTVKSNKLSITGAERKENLDFFAASNSGVIYYVNTNGSTSDVCQLDVPIKKLIFHEDRDLMVVITENLILYQFQVNPEGDLEEVSKVKLIGKTQEVVTTWAGEGILAISTGENLIRIWDIDMSDNYVLILEGSHFTDSQEVITSISFSTQKNVLGAGTSRGTVVMWKYLGDGSPAWRKESEKAWQLQSPTSVQAAVKHVNFGSNQSYLAVNTVRDVYILSEQILCAHYRDGLSAVQTSPTQLSIDLFATNQRINFRTDIQVRGIYITIDHLAVWNGKKIAVYEISTDSAKLIAVGSFGMLSNLIVMHENNVYTAEESKIYVRTYQGTIKQTLAFLEDEGVPTCMQISGTFLVVGTSVGIIKVWDVSRREAKLHVNPKSLSGIINGLGSVVSASCNSNGTKISFSISLETNNSIDSKLYIWIPETDTIQYFDFSLGLSDVDDESGLFLSKENDLTSLERNRLEIAKEVKGRYPVSHFWDPEESRQLICQASKPCPGNDLIQLPLSNEYWQSMTVSMLVTSEAGILIQEATCFENFKTKLLGINIPHYYLLCRPDTSIESSPSALKTDNNNKSKLSGLVAQYTLRDFTGLEDTDKKTRQAMINFSYFLTVGNLDEAFKAIKTIKSGSVWENMAKMCVKTKRLDVASVCLGNMGHARGAKALREAQKEPELDARVAYLALHLGMVDEAEKLLVNCNRYDLLNRVYQDSGQWAKALQVADKYDRIHLRCTYYNYAKYLEASGDIGGAIPNYEKSDTHRFEVPRMLFEEPQGLEEYISRSKDKSLQRWWAQYLESTGEMETALQYYELAQDYLSLVRVYCYCNNLEKAADIANDTGDKAACYHLGRQYENHDEIKEAVHFYTRAQAYSNAVRLCKEHGLEDQLLNLGLMGNKEEILDVAKYYENKPGQQANAIMLYHKAGLVGKAVELAFQTRQYSVLHQIASELTEKSDPQLVHRVAQFFVENSQFDKAVDLLAVSKRYVEALDLCVQHNISINEDLAEKLTPVKGEADESLRMRVLEKVADSCYQQENYQLATKKYTQAGNKIKAMKSLLKSGNTEKIIFFANVSRQKEIYIMAANYLQSLDWREQPEIMKHIIGFYTKGRSLDLLGGFYEACAQAEIDEYQNYEKALGALNEAYKCFNKIPDRIPTQDDRVAHLEAKLELVKKFVHARRVYETNPEEAMKFSQSLLSEPNLDVGVRRGDILGFMIEHYAKQNNYKTAYNLIEEMRIKLPNVNLAYYVNVQTIETIFARLNLPLNRASLGLNKDTTHSNAGGDEGDEIEEQVDEKTDIFSAGDVFVN